MQNLGPLEPLMQVEKFVSGCPPPTPFPQILIGLNMLCIILFMLVKLSYQTWDPWAPNASTKVCGGGGWWVGGWVCKPILVISLVPSPCSD